MTRIVLDHEQAQALAHAQGTVEVCDHDGKVLGIISAPLSPDELEQIAEIKRRLSKPQARYTTAQVREHLEKLGEK
jgi:hypothetical protein